MAEQRRNQRPTGGKPTGGRPTGKSTGKPAAKSTGKPPVRRGGSPGSAKSSERSSRWTPDQDSGSKGRPARSGGDRPGRKNDWKRTDRDVPRTASQAEYDGPDLPEGITGAEIDRSVTAQLKGLPEKLASRVARHLGAAAMFIDTNPELAYQHAMAARARAPRLAVVREATGESAYAAGHYAEALAELRAAKRMNGATAYLPIMADCHRALGKPAEALKLAKSPSVANFAPEAKAEMTIVEAGARRDLGQLDAALRTLELAPLMSKSRAPWVVRLRYAYADTLEAAGREQDALMWFHRTHSVDSDELTDAAERAEALEKRVN
ncbi:tetratricopeptide repeat protein [Nocardioides sp. CN2-186]|uniref:tetratricopeptide repeat protein n=1 Tax=Nocardioides tweenelious TaxID=3156607 RepID=UPI0032B5BBB1